jgi:hypothetical protein
MHVSGPLMNMSPAPAPRMMMMQKQTSMAAQYRAGSGLASSVRAVDSAAKPKVGIKGFRGRMMGKTEKKQKGVVRQSDDLGLDMEQTSEDEKEEEIVDYQRDSVSDGVAEGGSAAPGEATLRHIISLQTFSGSWAWSSALLKAVQVDAGAADVKQALAEGADETALATALVVRFLERKMSADKDVWELVVEKARAWIEGEGKEGLFDVADKVIV